jgi:hypothetical protein
MANKANVNSEYLKKSFRTYRNQKPGDRSRSKGLKLGGSFAVNKNIIRKRENRKMGMKKTTLAYARILEQEDFGINKAIAFLKSNKSK